VKVRRGGEEEEVKRGAEEVRTGGEEEQKSEDCNLNAE